MSGTDKACCSIPPVTTHNYEAKGTYIDIAGLKVYQTGPTTSKKALIAVYDIFGFISQTFQGADRLASSLDALVLMPDFFKGEPLPVALFPPDTEEKKKVVGKFAQSKADIGTNLAKLVEVTKEAKGKYSHVGSWGAYGLCWGGKITALASAADTQFKAAGTAHPGRLVKEEAEAMTIPYICLFSKEDGTPELMEEYGKAIESNNKDNVVEKYGTMHHGWMGGRADLENKENEKEFERGYNQFTDFFAKHL